MKITLVYPCIRNYGGWNSLGKHPSPLFFTPIVGTDLYNYCKTKDLIISENPSDLGSRSPVQPKIKGVDYNWLHKQVQITQLNVLGRKALVNIVKRRVRGLWSGFKESFH